VPEMPKSMDADIQRIIDQIRQRQAADEARLDTLTPGDLGFSMMRQVPRAQWNTTWPATDPALYKRGQKDTGFAANYPFNIWDPALRNQTPAQTILELFKLDDARKKEVGNDPSPR
jgi:hypothetical protein